MNLIELKTRIAEVLGVSDSERELAYDIFINNTFQVLDPEETLKIPRIGFFQYKTRPFKINGTMISDEDSEFKNVLVYSPLTEDLSRDSFPMFLTIEIKHQKKDLFELDENVFSIGVGKPILPLSNDKKSGDAETSYVLLKKSIEERVGEIISESEHLKNFDIWEDHISMIDTQSADIKTPDSSTIHKLTDDIEYTEEEIKAAVKDSSIITNKIEDEKVPLSTSDVPDITEDELAALTHYDELSNEDNDYEELKSIEVNPEDETVEFTPPSKSSTSKKTEFWGIEDFKSSSEKHDKQKNKTEEEEEVDWDWGDDLLSDKEDEPHGVEEFEKGYESMSDDKLDEEKNTNLFIQLEKSLSGTEDETDGEDLLDKEINEKNVLLENEPNETEDRDENNIKPKYIRNFIILFGAFVVVLMLIFIFVKPGTNKPVLQNQDLTNEEQPADIITRQPADIESETQSLNETRTPDEIDPGESVTVSDTDDSQIEEKTRQIEETVIPATSSQNNLYRNIPNETSVRGLIFTDGTKYFVQVSSWPIRVKAETETRRLRGLGFDAFIVEAYIQKYRSTWYRVKIGDFNSVFEAERFLQNNKF